jgi:hypothetical protein
VNVNSFSQNNTFFLKQEFSSTVFILRIQKLTITGDDMQENI